MRFVVYSKFVQSNDLRDLLVATGDELLVEGNSWHDTYWGVCNGKGTNNLGKILMETRLLLSKEESFRFIANG